MTRRLLRAACFIVAISGPAVLGTAACGKSVGNTIDDATITGRVKTAMLNDPQVAGLKIEVAATDHQVEKVLGRLELGQVGGVVVGDVVAAEHLATRCVSVYEHGEHPECDPVELDELAGEGSR